MFNRLSIFLTLLFFWAFPAWAPFGVAFGQAVSSTHQSGLQDESVLVVKAEAVPSACPPGSVVTVKVTVALEEGWHIYSMDTEGGPTAARLKLFSGEGYTVLQGVEAPPPRRIMDEGFGIEVGIHEGTVSFHQEVKIDPGAAGKVTILGEFYAQGCSDTTCLTPGEHPFEAALFVGDGAEEAGSLHGDRERNDDQADRAEGSGSGNIIRENKIPESLMNARIVAVHPGMERDEKAFLIFLRGGLVDSEKDDKGWFWIILAGFLSGLVALATPCVYPMIPITVSFFTKVGEKRGGRSLGPALVYCAGIILSFTALGLLLTLFLGASGTQDFGASPVVNGFVGVLFVVFAFSLFGFYELRLPKFLSSLAGVNPTTGGIPAILLMGLTFSVTSFACTGPFIGAVLAGAVTRGYLAPALAMLGFSSALALPFFFLALIPQLLAGLPKSGGWLLSVKVVMGFLELAAAFKFLANVDQVLGWGVLSRGIVIGIWIAIGLAAAVYFIRPDRFFRRTASAGIGLGRVVAALLFLALSLRMVPALSGAPLGELDAHLPPIEEECDEDEEDCGVSWGTDLIEAEKESRKTGKPLFLNFTGHACTNCRWMESNMFHRQSVIDELDNYIPLELFTDRKGDPGEELNRTFREKKFNTVANPLYAVIELR